MNQKNYQLSNENDRMNSNYQVSVKHIVKIIIIYRKAIFKFTMSNCKMIYETNTLILRTTLRFFHQGKIRGLIHILDIFSLLGISRVTWITNTLPGTFEDQTNPKNLYILYYLIFKSYFQILYRNWLSLLLHR